LAFVRIKSLNPSKITLPFSGNTLEVRCSNDEDYQYMMAVYINSTPDDFAERFLQGIMISGQIDIKSLPLDDLHFLLTRLLEKEGKYSSLPMIADKSVVLKTFRDEIIGVPFSRYISKKDKMRGSFQKECDRWLKTIEALIEKNDSEKKNLEFSALLDKNRKEEKSDIRWKKWTPKSDTIERRRCQDERDSARKVHEGVSRRSSKDGYGWRHDIAGGGQTVIITAIDVRELAKGA